MISARVIVSRSPLRKQDQIQLMAQPIRYLRVFYLIKRISVDRKTGKAHRRLFFSGFLVKLKVIVVDAMFH